VLVDRATLEKRVKQVVARGEEPDQGGTDGGSGPG
jgi:hypothetical protein